MKRITSGHARSDSKITTSKSTAKHRAKTKRVHQTDASPLKGKAWVRAVFERANIGIAIVNLDQVILECNSAFRKMLGYRTHDLYNLPLNRLVYPKDLSHGPPEAQELAAGKRSHYHTEKQYLHKDGQLFWGRLNVSLVRDAAIKPHLAIAILEDITEYKLALEALHESEEKFRLLAENSPFCIYAYREKFVYVNPAFEPMTGYTVDELLGMNFWELVHPDSRDLVRQRGAARLQGEKVPDHYEIKLVRKDGDERWIDAAATVVQFGGESTGIGIFTDITERKHAEEEGVNLFEQVRIGREQLQALSRRLVEVQETERRHIARELHDEVGQVLTGLKLLLETSRQLPAETLHSRFSTAQSLVEQLLEQVQGMSLDLRPTMLDDLGLLPALLWFTKRFADQTGIRVHLEHTGLDRRFAPEIETAIYRITQEALTNVARHASVAEATARIWLTQDTLNVQVEDRGPGFNVQAARAAPTSSGLSGMRERANALGGNLIIESTPGVGTRVTLQVPLSGSLERRMKER